MDNVSAYLDKVRQDVVSENWDNAKMDMEKLETAWGMVIPRIQYSVERDDINSLNRNLTRLRSWITVKDKPNSLVELQEAEMFWDKLGK
ncbi:MAG: DUF4363 family protein [Syntrophomonadaceae bacterium]|nr:DUF4363 family protein [Syntrophomonadaceae bacterium]